MSDAQFVFNRRSVKGNTSENDPFFQMQEPGPGREVKQRAAAARLSVCSTTVETTAQPIRWRRAPGGARFYRVRVTP
jgi:hypothetical protein